MSRVRLLATYPVKDAPGRQLSTCEVRSEGLLGDRRKKSPVHLVGSGQTPETTRANIFLDMDPDILRTLVGADVRIGQVCVRIMTEPSACPGVYADVVTPGVVTVGDEVRLA